MTCCGGCNNCKCEDDKKMEEIINSLDLSKKYKLFLKHRYLDVVNNFEQNSNKYLIVSNILRFSIGIGTILTPIILSLQGTFIDYAELIYWIVLSVSTVTGILNMTIELFKFRENYIISKLSLESLKSEGWEYFQLTGDYKPFKTNKEAYEKFAGQIEKITKRSLKKSFSLLKGAKKNKSVEEEESTSADLFKPNIGQNIEKIGDALDSELEKMEQFNKNAETI